MKTTYVAIFSCLFITISIFSTNKSSKKRQQDNLGHSYPSFECFSNFCAKNLIPTSPSIFPLCKDVYVIMSFNKPIAITTLVEGLGLNNQCRCEVFFSITSSGELKVSSSQNPFGSKFEVAQSPSTLLETLAKIKADEIDSSLVNILKNIINVTKNS